MIDPIQLVNDERLRTVASSDRWSFVVFIAYANAGAPDLASLHWRQGLAFNLGVDIAVVPHIARRLVNAGLIDPETWAPIERSRSGDES